MTYQTERDDFIARLTRDLSATAPHLVADAARKLLRHAATHGRLSVESCNGHPAQSSPFMDATTVGKLQDKWDARIERETARVERLITAICTPLGIVPDFTGDPRGYTVKLHLPSGSHNTMGGRESGYGIPQRSK